jgi:hypothetical protein
VKSITVLDESELSEPLKFDIAAAKSRRLPGRKCRRQALHDEDEGSSLLDLIVSG